MSKKQTRPRRKNFKQNTPEEAVIHVPSPQEFGQNFLEEAEFIVGKRKASRIPLVGLNQKQKDYIKAIQTKEQIICRGVPGSGKTYIVATLAAQMLQDKKIQKIVISRPNVSSSKSLGYSPGTTFEKLSLWVAPLLAVLKKELGTTFFEYCLRKEMIEVIPFETMRGRSFDDAVVIIDEFQSTTIEEATCIVTRIGQNTKLVMLGDVRQKDIRQEGGLEFVSRILKNNEDLQKRTSEHEFGIEDVVRSDLCASWVRALYS